MEQQATANGRSPYFEGQHAAEEPSDTAARLALVAERDALRYMTTWAYSKLHSLEFSRQEDALELDRLKLYTEHGVVA
jgi:hypothetical protein